MGIWDLHLGLAITLLCKFSHLNIYKLTGYGPRLTNKLQVRILLVIVGILYWVETFAKLLANSQDIRKTWNFIGSRH